MKEFPPEIDLLPRNIRNLMEKKRDPKTGKKYTQLDLARDSHVSENSIGKLLNRRIANPKTDVLVRIAAALGVQIADLFAPDVSSVRTPGVKGICSICGIADDELTHLQLYVNGSEGIHVCLRCRIVLTDCARAMQSAASRARLDEKKKNARAK